jgi:hypothetical protein
MFFRKPLWITTNSNSNMNFLRSGNTGALQIVVLVS